MKENHNLYPDFIFFTGDLALGQIGNSKGLTLNDQYEEAKEFFKRILKIFPNLDVSNIFIVPGNHDVNRNKVLGSQTVWLDSFRTKKSENINHDINELIMSNKKEWKNIIERFEDYKLFLEQNGYKHLLDNPDHLSYSLIRQINGVNVGVAGFNSSWSSCRDDEKGKIWFGTCQVSNASHNLRDTTFSIAISHHPPNWFTEHEDPMIDRKIARKFQFYLHGHEHKEWVTQSEEYIRIASGALYNGSDKENGYNFVRLYPSENRGEVFLRTYNNDTWIQKIVGNKTNNEGIWAIKNLNIIIKEEESSAVEVCSVCETKTGCTSIYTQGSRPDIDPEKIFGRENELKSIEDELKNKNILIISGLRGTGKSTLASMFVDKMEKTGKFVGIFWQKVDETTDISDIIDKFFTTIGKPLQDLARYTIAEQINLFFNKLKDDSYLLVLDNFEVLLDPKTNRPLESKIGFSELIEKANEKCMKSKILFTSWESFSSERGIKPYSYQVKGLDASAGILLLKREGLDESGNVLGKAITFSGGHPLALILLAQLVRDRVDTLSALLSDDSLWIGKSGEVADKILNKVYNERLSEDERKVFQLISIFRQPVPAKAIVAIANDPTWTELKVNRIALSLIYKSLLQKNEEGYWEDSLISKYVTTVISVLSDYHKLASQYYLSIPLSAKPSKKEDVHSLIEAHYHACLAKEYDQAFKIIFDNDLQENLSIWGNFTVLVDLYSLMLPEDHLGEGILLENKGNHGVILGYLGSAYYHLDENNKSIKYYEQALKIAREIGNRKFEGTWLVELGIVYTHISKYRQAKEYLEQALKIAQEIGDRRLEGNCLGNIGQVFDNLSEHKKAIEYSEKALEIAREIGDRRSEGRWLGDLGYFNIDLGEYRKSINYFELALEIAREIGDQSLKGRWLGDLGIVYRNLGEYNKSIEYFEQALKISREIGSRLREGCWLYNIGSVYSNLSDYIKAKEYLEQALKIGREAEDRKTETCCFLELGTIFFRREEYIKAIEYYEKSIKLAQEIGNRNYEELCLGNMGLVYSNMRYYIKAIDHYEQALKIANEIEERKNEETWLENIGEEYKKLGEFKKAINYFEEALKIARETGDRLNEGYYLENLGYAHFLIREYEKAIEYFEQGLSIGKEIEDQNMINYCEENLKMLDSRRNYIYSLLHSLLRRAP